MRRFLLATLLFGLAATQASAATSRDEILSRAKSAGYRMIAKAEFSGDTWDVWASKDGIPYEMKFNADDGALIAAVPVDAND